MRRLTRDRDDSGAATIFMVLAMPVLIIFGALTFDGARGYVARRETQNSADAAALAMATDCAKGLSTCVSGADATAGNYNRSLAQRSSITNEDVVIAETYCDTTAGLCKATMKQSIGFHFAPGGGDVDRSGTAKWGGVGAADTVPLVLSECDFQRITAGGTPTGTQTVYFHSEPVNTTGPFPCNASSSGLNIPGGFGWISGAATGNPCIVHVTLSTPSDQGNSPPSTCNKEADWDPMLGRDWLIPIYGATNGHNYTITGFAQFTFQGYKWNGSKSGGTLDGMNCPDPVTGAPMDNSVTCLQGKFKPAVVHGPGGGFDFDATTVWLAS